MKKPKQQYHALLNVGASATEKTLPALTASLVKILASPGGDEVKKAAIAALSASFTVQNV